MSSSTDAKTVLLNVRNRHEKDYPLATGAEVLPGMLVELNNAFQVQPFDAVATPAPILVAVEMPIRSGADIDTVFDQAGEAVPVHSALSGDNLYMMLEAGANVAKGALLESSGNGYLQAATSYAIVRALEDVNNNTGYDGKRIRVTVL